jgi:hypothetical protein
MAKIYIDNGINIDPSWSGHIAISADGNRWDTISKEGIDVKAVFVDSNTASPVSIKSPKCIVKLVRGDSENEVVRFDLEDVANQAGWTGGASVVDDYLAALADLTNWLSPSGATSLSQVSDVNSSTAILGASTTFTGVAELNQSPDVMVWVSTDQNGMLYVEFSPDGVNWDTSLGYIYDTGRINPPHVFVKAERYFRVRFTNTSTSAQTYFRLNTYYGKFDKLTTSINGTLAENYDAIATRPTQYSHEVAMGKRQGRKLWSGFAANLDVDSASPEIISDSGITSMAIMTSADTLDIVSDQASDTNTTGTGGWMIQIEGISDEHLHQTEIVVLNGLTPVTTSKQWLGVNRAYLIASGSSDTNDGNITITDTGAAAGTQCFIKALESVSHDGWFHTQINHNFLLEYVKFSARQESGGGAPRITFSWESYSRVTDTTYIVGETFMDTSVDNHITINLQDVPLVFGGREVLYWKAETTRDNAPVSVRFSGIEERVS